MFKNTNIDTNRLSPRPHCPSTALYTIVLPDVIPLKKVSAAVTYGMGLFTCIEYAICSILGTKCEGIAIKIEQAEKDAIRLMQSYAEELGAEGIMDIHYQVLGTTVFVSGTAYIEKD